MAARKKHLIFIHGRHFKPDKAVLTANWKAALGHGVQRDCSAAKLAKYKAVKKTMIYYGDISNAFLRGEAPRYDKRADALDRKRVLADLKEYATDDFRPPRAKKIYKNLPGKTAMKEFLADTFGGLTAAIGVSKPLISMVAPDMNHYWNMEKEFGSEVRWRLTEPLAKALRADHDVLLISHSLGTMISYDVLWKFSHYGEYRNIRNKKITNLITMGSPLGDETVKKNLKGANAGGARRYPTNIKQWDNFSAEDDFIAHDQNIKNDYKKMVPSLCDKIVDHSVYNFSVRTSGKQPKSNPHHATGYLVCPDVVDVVAKWL